ncbi:hypothetical protein, partial [Phaeobacter sp. SYSU ZJ3003]|uniref:hypothetical protein n=1 Tax=Phaeobacter sp. SYSU ZJ3003 TaxID=2109330 RepID=UPI00351C28AC
MNPRYNSRYCGLLTVLLSRLLISLATLFAPLCTSAIAQSQQTLLLGFPDGFIGEYGSVTPIGPAKPNNIRSFSELGISRVVLSQQSSAVSGGVPVFQGNDAPFAITFIFSDGRASHTQAANLNWSSNGTPTVFGFYTEPASDDDSGYYDGLTSALQGTAQGISFALAPNGTTVGDGASYTFDISSDSYSGSSDNPISELNDLYLATQAQSPSGPVTVNSQTTSDTTPVVTGTLTWTESVTDEVLKVFINGVLYTQDQNNSLTSPLVISGPAGAQTWSLTIPDGDALQYKTYDVLAQIENTAGYVASDSTSNELDIVDGTASLSLVKTAQLRDDDGTDGV